MYFDKHVLSPVEGLSLSDSGLGSKGLFPLTLNYYLVISSRGAQIYLTVGGCASCPKPVIGPLPCEAGEG